MFHNLFVVPPPVGGPEAHDDRGHHDRGRVAGCLGGLRDLHYVTLQSRLVRDVTMLADILGTNSTAALTFKDATAAGDTLRAMALNEHILGARLFTREGVLLASYDRRGLLPVLAPPNAASATVGQAGVTFEGDLLRVVRTISLDNETIGTIEVESDTAEVSTMVTRFGGIFAASYTAFDLNPTLAPASRDVTAATEDGSAPRVQWQLRGSYAPVARAAFNLSIFHVGALPRLQVWAYTRVDLTADWRFTSRLSRMASGQNLPGRGPCRVRRGDRAGSGHGGAAQRGITAEVDVQLRWRGIPGQKPAISPLGYRRFAGCRY